MFSEGGDDPVLETPLASQKDMGLSGLFDEKNHTGGLYDLLLIGLRPTNQVHPFQVAQGLH